MQFEGIYTPVITPFHANAEIDWDGWVEMIEHLISKGGHAIVVGGSTGEFYALSPEERLDQFKRATEIIKGRVPWVAGVNDFRTQACCDFATAAREAGADGLLVAAPPYSTPSELELVEHCIRVDAAGKLPIMLYNYPARTGVMMGEDFLEGVRESANVQAIKESSGDVNRIHLLVSEYPHLQLSCGADDQALEFFAWGARSWVCAAANCLIEECVALHQACVIEKDFDKGRRITRAMLPFLTVLERGGKFLSCVKYGCELQGLPGGAVREPLQPLDDTLEARMHEVLDAAKRAVAEVVGGKADAARRAG